MCKIMALKVTIMGLGLLFYILLGFRYPRAAMWFLFGSVMVFFVKDYDHNILPRKELHRIFWVYLQHSKSLANRNCSAAPVALMPNPEYLPAVWHSSNHHWLY